LEDCANVQFTGIFFHSLGATIIQKTNFFQNLSDNYHDILCTKNYSTCSVYHLFCIVYYVESSNPLKGPKHVLIELSLKKKSSDICFWCHNCLDL